MMTLDYTATRSYDNTSLASTSVQLTHIYTDIQHSTQLMYAPHPLSENVHKLSTRPSVIQFAMHPRSFSTLQFIFLVLRLSSAHKNLVLLIRQSLNKKILFNFLPIYSWPVSWRFVLFLCCLLFVGGYRRMHAKTSGLGQSNLAFRLFSCVMRRENERNH